MSIDLDLDDFASELPTGSIGSAGSAGPGTVTIADILATSTPLHWDEAVAVLQELLALVTSMRRDDIPAFEDVVIDSEGTLMIRSLRHGERGPLAAGRALHALLSSADVPVALRLFVTQANAPETHPSLDAFAKALAYFGKSDRANMIRAVYARYKPSATAVRPTAPVPAPPAPRPPALPGKPEPIDTPRTVQHGLVAVAAVVAVVSIGAIGWLLFGHSTQAATTPESAPAETASTVLARKPARAPAAAAATTKVASPSASTSAPGVDAKRAFPAAVTPAPTSSALTTLRDSRAVMAPAPGLDSSRVRATQPSRASRSADLALDVALAEPAQIASLAGALAPGSPSISTVVTSQQAALASAVYSRDDADVQPPVMLYPQLPPQLFIGAPSEGMINRMELVVAPDGSVERVRLTAAPRRMADMMLLSGAKLWRFAPAVKDGVPVRYRTTVTWTVFP